MMDAELPIRQLIRFLTSAVAAIIPPILAFTALPLTSSLRADGYP
jgi:hypothetical protein